MASMKKQAATVLKHNPPPTIKLKRTITYIDDDENDVDDDERRMKEIKLG